MALLSYLKDLDTDESLLGLVADDDGVDYVWPDGVEPWFDGHERMARLLDSTDRPEPTTAQEWLSLAVENLGRVGMSEPVEVDSVEAGTTQATDALKQPEPAKGDTPTDIAPGQDPDSTGLLGHAADAFDDVSVDYPGFAESDDAGEDPQAMLNFLMSTVGPIDPDGPNGWILRAADGEPQPGDEGLPIHFPGTPLPDTAAAPAETPEPENAVEDAAGPAEETGE